MALHDYTVTPSPSGFRGYRVVRCVAGKTTQKYFGAHEYAAAKSLDDRLKTKQIRYWTRQHKTAKTAATPYNYDDMKKRFAAPRRTPVRGLTLVLQCSYRCSPPRYYPSVQIASGNAAGERIHTSRAITPNKRTYTEAWREACQVLAKHVGLKRTPSHWYKAQPNAQQFFDLVKHYKLKPHNLPMDSMNLLREELTT